MLLWLVILWNFSVSEFLNKIMVIDNEIIGNNKLLNNVLVFSIF